MPNKSRDQSEYHRAIANKERQRVYHRQCYLMDREARIARSLQWQRDNRDAYNDRQREWYKNNPERVKEMRSTPQRRIAEACRASIRNTLRSRSLTKSIHTIELAGTNDIRAKIEAKFLPGITWENYGKAWHLDHIRPCASFDLTDPIQQRACFHYNNLQPMWWQANLRKGAKLH